MRLCPLQEMPPAALTVHAPYDTDARWATKRSTTWTGYKVHLSETCDAERPHLIMQVATTRVPSHRPHRTNGSLSQYLWMK